MTAPQFFAAIVCVCLCAPAWAASRFEQFTKKFEKTADRAEIISSTFLGGSGTEWLTAGGIQPDGMIVVAGVALGPSLDLGTTPAVLGNDQPIATPARRPKMDRRGRVEKDRNGQPKYEPFSWHHAHATAFLVRLSPDLQTIKSAMRFGWKSGGLTDAAVDAKGNIYLCGPATPGITNISSDFQELPPPVRPSNKGECAQVFLAKISPDGGKALWVRSVRGPSGAPGLRLAKDGKVHFHAQDVRVFDADGNQLSQVAFPESPNGRLAVSPVDGSFAIGGEHQWSTGREPYRDPTLNIYRPDGTWLYELYNWDGPFVGLNSLRLVAGSAVRGTAYGDDGTLVIHGWSAGTNSVLLREPTDVYTRAGKNEGLGFDTRDAGVLNCSYVIQLDPRTWKVAASTLWVGYLADRDRPNNISIDNFGIAVDGSVCLAGESAWGLIQTGNAFPGDPTGDYVAVLSRDLTSLRFSSTLPGTGQTDIASGARWGMASGTIKGKPAMLFLSGAVEGAEALVVPKENARQGKFGGGFSDGHLLLLDLSPGQSQ